VTVPCASHFLPEIDALKRQGVDLDVVTIDGQAYCHVRKIPSPVPPWDRAAHDILIALPLAETGALDAFYLEMPYAYGGSTHSRVNGAEISYDDRTWKLVSWHYLEGHAWKVGQDDLDSHIEHCRGFFLARAAHD